MCLLLAALWLSQQLKTFERVFEMNGMVAILAIVVVLIAAIGVIRENRTGKTLPPALIVSLLVVSVVTVVVALF